MVIESSIGAVFRVHKGGFTPETVGDAGLD